jgi:hypothetical protein
MIKQLEIVADEFENRIRSVFALLEFDNLVLEHLIGGIDDIATKLEDRGHRIAANDVRHRLQALQNIRAASSLRKSYQTIFNQCVVLLVSYFGATMSDLFRSAVATALRSGIQVPAADRQVQVTWRNLGQPDSPVECLIADRLVHDDDIKFQDMQSIVRAFEKALGLQLVASEFRNNIILGQAARNVIAHAGGVVDRRLLAQVKNAQPRQLKPELALGAEIQFEPAEIKLLADSMTQYVCYASDCVTSLIS